MLSVHAMSRELRLLFFWGIANDLHEPLASAVAMSKHGHHLKNLWFFGGVVFDRPIERIIGFNAFYHIAKQSD